MTICGLRKLS